jgi:hypothetical protein
LASYEEIARLVAEAARLDPLVGALVRPRDRCWFHTVMTRNTRRFVAVRALVPRRPSTRSFVMPAGRMGGADYVAALLARALSEKRQTS